MKIRSENKNYEIYALDIESHNDDESIAAGVTSMWLGCLINDESKIDDPSSFFYTMNELLDRLEKLSSRRHGDTHRAHNILIYVFNLSFEYSFLLPVLLDNGWTWKEKAEKDDKKIFSAVTNKTMTQVWEIKLKFNYYHGDIVIRDLSKIYSGSLRSVAKSFGLKTQKGEIDYKKNRLHDYVITDEEREYCFNDTHIVIEILQILIDRNDHLFFRSLSASSYAAQNMIRSNGDKKAYSTFRKTYPALTGDEAVFVRKTVAGGITYATPRYQFKDITDRVCHIDANQMHPSSAYLNEYPYGRGTYGTGRPELKEHEIAAVHIKVSYSGVKLHSVIKLIGIESASDCELYLWSFEIPVLERCYLNLKIKYIDYYKYKAKLLYWRDYYLNNWNERMKSIDEGDAFGKIYYKLLNNSSYGKLIERPHLRTFENIIDEHGLANSKVTDKELPENSPKNWNAKFTYAPIGSCIPAYSRKCLIEKALDLGWENIIYFDTDSIFFRATDDAMKTLMDGTCFESVLGGWKIEEYIEESQFTAPKRYKVKCENGDLYIRAAGFNFEDTSFDDFDDIDIIDSTWNVKRRIRVQGGSIIGTQVKEIKVQDKYSQTLENNLK